MHIEIGKEIRRLRKANKMTLKQVAAAANMSVSYLSELERGIRHTGRIVTLGKIASVFDIRLSVIIGRAEIAVIHRKMMSILNDPQRSRKE